MKESNLIKKISTYIVVGSFLLLLLIPLLAFNHEEGKISVSENRHLASFPTIFKADGSISDGLDKSLEVWFKDNLGLRGKFLNLQQYITVNLLGQSSVENVQIGKSGWLFYTPSYNLELAKGTYPLSNDDISTTAEIQQAISDNLSKRGISYLYSIFPSKASIYPEYIGDGDYQVGETACDRIIKYMGKNTNVLTAPVKQTLINKKEKYKVYFKSDTHWTFRGAYNAYEELFLRMQKSGLIKAASSPVKAVFTPSTHVGDLAVMLGGNTEKWREESENVTISAKAKKLDSGPLYNAVGAAVNKGTQYFVFENQNAVTNKTLLILGDSMMEDYNIPSYFAEEFSKVCFVRTSDITEKIIEAVQPNVLLWTRGERDAFRFKEYNGRFLEYQYKSENVAISSGKLSDQIWGNVETVTSKAGYLNVAGWACIQKMNCNSQQVFLEVDKPDGGKVTYATQMIPRSDVVDYLGSEIYANAGFYASLPANGLSGKITMRLIVRNGETELTSPDFVKNIE